MNQSEAISVIVDAWQHNGLAAPRCAACLLQLFRLKDAELLLRSLPPDFAHAVRLHIHSIPDDANYWHDITDQEWALTTGPIQEFRPRKSRSIHRANTKVLRRHFSQQDERVADERVADESVADESVADESVADESVADDTVLETSANPIAELDTVVDVQPLKRVPS